MHGRATELREFPDGRGLGHVSIRNWHVSCRIWRISFSRLVGFSPSPEGHYQFGILHAFCIWLSSSQLSSISVSYDLRNLLHVVPRQLCLLTGADSHEVVWLCSPTRAFEHSCLSVLIVVAANGWKRIF